MSTINTYKVHYHYEISGKKAPQFGGEQLTAHVAASASDAATIAAVIAADIRAVPTGATIFIDNVVNTSPGAINS